jgi:shikimate dehydrogenase
MNSSECAATGPTGVVPEVFTIAAQPVLLGVLGSPIGHSAAPSMHEAAAEAAGLRAQYRLIDIAGADRAKLRLVLEGVRLLGFAGINVTFPYKEAVVPLLDSLSDLAAAIGAVNTIVVRDGKLIGHNTDAIGFARAFTQVLGPPGNAPVALIGAGGVGCAIAFAMAEIGARELRIVDTAAGKATALAERLRGRLAAHAASDAAAALNGAGGVINATAIGMLPDRGTPVPPELITDAMWVADAVYTPLWTPLLQAAKARGARVMTGRELSIQQAVDAFLLFTGREASQDSIAKAFDAAMARRMTAEH